MSPAGRRCLQHTTSWKTCLKHLLVPLSNIWKAVDFLWWQKNVIAQHSETNTANVNCGHKPDHERSSKCISKKVFLITTDFLMRVWIIYLVNKLYRISRAQLHMHSNETIYMAAYRERGWIRILSDWWHFECWKGQSSDPSIMFYLKVWVAVKANYCLLLFVFMLEMMCWYRRMQRRKYNKT